MARIIQKSVLFAAARVTKFKVQNPPPILPTHPNQCNWNHSLLLQFLYFFLFYSYSSPIFHLLCSPNTLNFFHKVYFKCNLFIYLFDFTSMAKFMLILPAQNNELPFYPKKIISDSHIRSIKKLSLYLSCNANHNGHKQEPLKQARTC